MRSNKIELIVFLVAASALVLAACGGSDSSGTNNAASLAMKGTSGNLVNMNGTWTNCSYKAADQQDERTVITINGGSATMQNSVWSAAATQNCQQTGTPDMVVVAGVTATLGAEATATWTDGAGSTQPPAGVSATAKATQATIVFNSVTVRLNSTAWRDFFNSNSFCGKTDWAVGVVTNVLNCTTFIPSTTETDYWVVDDSAAPLKWYSSDSATAAFQVDSINPMLK